MISLLLSLTSCIPDPVEPRWLDSFVAFADTSTSYPRGSELLRCYWNKQWVFETNTLLSSCIGCQVLTEDGDTLRFQTTAEQLDYLEGRRRCQVIWVKE